MCVCNRLPIGFSDQIAIFFVEVLIAVLSGKYLQKFMQKNLLNVFQLEKSGEDQQGGDAGIEQRSLVSALAGHPVACRALRAAALAVTKAKDMESLLEALSLPGGPDGQPGLRRALEAGQHYLFTTLSAACRKQSSEKIQVIFEKVYIMLSYNIFRISISLSVEVTGGFLCASSAHFWL